MCEKEEFFLGLIDGFTWKYDNEQPPNFLFGCKGGVYLFAIYFGNDSKFNQKKFLACHRLKIEQVVTIDVFIDNKTFFSMQQFHIKDNEIE